jgi:exo-beta-1,3-glucanase (GH17 family)/cellulose synthase/poly-beta-1,6-N-acetylglucosamine synthase-like glycosyltransferase
VSLKNISPFHVRYRFVAALVLAAGVALANFFLWSTLGARQQAPDVPTKLNGLTYAPFGRDDAPWIRTQPVAQLVSDDLKLLAGLTSQIRVYSAAQFPELSAIAAENGLKVTLGAWLNSDHSHNEKEIAVALQIAQAQSNVTRLVVGNETLLKENLTPTKLITYLKQVRLASQKPVSTAEPWHVWLKYPELADEVDFITVHLLPYWEGVGIETALEESLQRLTWVRDRHPNKEIVIGEVGFPSTGKTIKRAIPSPAVQAAFVRQFIARAEQARLDYFFIEAFDQPWKRHEEGLAGAYWGLFDAARNPKFAFSGVIESDPHWQSRALGSSLAGFVLLSCFLYCVSGLRTLARVAFAAAAQMVLTLATVVVTLPLWHYMSAGDWWMLALLIPTTTVMVLILLTHLFEFVELFWEGSLNRRFAPQPLAKDAPQPFVSIHLACCNEPPQMVIATLKSLRDLHYSAFEVIVVDNNTRHDALWIPVRDFMSTLPENFRFFHLPVWQGFKAGALNFALEQTDQRAQVIGVVDADYIVKPEWLHSLVSYFNQSNVGIVQAPQAHRDWGDTLFSQMMNWEYDGFFRIGMHHRNERNAIIQHGTMTLIRASALRQYGRWSEWCLCEDAELGLRLMKQNLRTVYVDAVMGEGLTPDNFGSFKKQRQRWAQGGMQILKSHWQSLLSFGKNTKKKPATQMLPSHHLSLGQKYHYIAGWLPWTGDALHLIFVGGALLWTIGMLSIPSYFSPPVLLLLLPLAIFCSTKLIIGPLLYWRRVPCSIGDILGASIAGMGLSHAIAKGILAGLFTKTGIFHVTAKGEQFVSAQTSQQKSNHWLASSREEFMLLIALAMAMSATAITRTPGHVESLIWIVMLGLQALPYASAVACSAAASVPRKPLSTAYQSSSLGTGSPRLNHEASSSR